MNKRLLSTACILVVFTTGMTAQDVSVQDKLIDVFLNKTITAGTELENVHFLDDIAVTRGQSMLLASSDAIYNIGYGAFTSCKMADKELSAFNILNDKIYFAAQSTLYRLNAGDKAKKVMELPFNPHRMWGGSEVLYAFASDTNRNSLYAIEPNKGECTKIFKAESPIVGVGEFGECLMILCEDGFYEFHVRKGEYIKLPYNRRALGKLCSMTIDTRTGTIYLSAENGVFRIYEKQVQKICGDTGTLFFDADGLLVFNAQSPYILRLANELLYPDEKVIIQIR